MVRGLNTIKVGHAIAANIPQIDDMGGGHGEQGEQDQRRRCNYWCAVSHRFVIGFYKTRMFSHWYEAFHILNIGNVRNATILHSTSRWHNRVTDRLATAISVTSVISRDIWPTETETQSHVLCGHSGTGIPGWKELLLQSAEQTWEWGGANNLNWFYQNYKWPSPGLWPQLAVVNTHCLVK